jgi:hypothetical protein
MAVVRNSSGTLHTNYYGAVTFTLPRQPKRRHAESENSESGVRIWLLRDKPQNFTRACDKATQKQESLKEDPFLGLLRTLIYYQFYRVCSTTPSSTTACFTTACSTVGRGRRKVSWRLAVQHFCLRIKLADVSGGHPLCAFRNDRIRNRLHT